MIAELGSSHRVAESFRQLAQVLTGRSEPKRNRASLLSPFLDKLLKRSA
jgi:pilus assembly protein CpaE